MIPYAPLTKKQSDYVKRCMYCWLNVAEGGKRAGKNIINTLAYGAVLEDHPDRLHLVAGVTLATAKMNVIDSNGFGLKHIFKGRCREGKFEERDALYIQTRTGEKIVICAGGGKANDAARIKGNSYGTVYITEVNECHQSFVQEVFDRTLASSKRQLFFDLNPMSPSHWFYSEILDYQDALKERGENPFYNYEHFTIADNMSLSDDKLREVLATYDKTSLWYMADILGKRTAASGRIYERYSYKDVVITPDYISDKEFKDKGKRFVQFSISVDIGGTDATVATLTGFTERYREAIKLDGYYHKQGKNTSGYTQDSRVGEDVSFLCAFLF